jgi:hypothetical protein
MECIASEPDTRYLVPSSRYPVFGYMCDASADLCNHHHLRVEGPNATLGSPPYTKLELFPAVCVDRAWQLFCNSIFINCGLVLLSSNAPSVPNRWQRV